MDGDDRTPHVAFLQPPTSTPSSPSLTPEQQEQARQPSQQSFQLQPGSGSLSAYLSPTDYVQSHQTSASLSPSRSTSPSSSVASLSLSREASPQPYSLKEPTPTNDHHEPAAGGGGSMTISSRIGSTGSQIISPVNEVRKRTGRGVPHRPKPLNLDHTTPTESSSTLLTPQIPHPSPGVKGPPSDLKVIPPLLSPSACGAESDPGQSTSVPPTGVLIPESSNSRPVVSTSKGPKGPKGRGTKFPTLHIRTDLTLGSDSTRRAQSGPFTSTANTTSHTSGITFDTSNSGNSNAGVATAATTAITHPTHHQQQANGNIKAPKKVISKWQKELERLLKKIQRRKRAPSNLTWYASLSTQSYLSGMPVGSQSGGRRRSSSGRLEQESEETESLCFDKDKAPKWVTDSFNDEGSFFSDDTIDVTISLRDFLIRAAEGGWDISELKEEVQEIGHKSMFHPKRNRSASPSASPRIASPVLGPSVPASPSSHDSPTSSHRGSRSSFEFDAYSHHPVGRPLEEESSCRLLDYLIAIMSDIISYDCRYKVQHPRPSRPEWALHSIVLDILTYLSKALAHDHKAMYDLGLTALSAFPIFKNHSLVRLLSIMTDIIIPSFIQSRQSTISPSLAASSLSPLRLSPLPLTPTQQEHGASATSPSEIRVNNQTFAIQVHSPTDEKGLLSVPRVGRPSLGSPRIPSSRSSSTSFSRTGPLIPQIQDSVEEHTASLISMTLVAALRQISLSKSPLPVIKQLQESVGQLLRIKPNLSSDLLEAVALVENEQVTYRALDILSWIARPSLGHHILSENRPTLDYEVILATHRAKQDLPTTLPGMTIIGNRTSTFKSDATSSFRRGSLDEDSVPRTDEIGPRSNTIGSGRIRTMLPYRNPLPRKATAGSESLLPHSQHTSTHEQTHLGVASHGPGFNFLVEHEIYPYLFSAPECPEDTAASRKCTCERCDQVLKGYGLYCYHCRSSIHLECFYSLKKFAGMEYSLAGHAFDYVSRSPRNQLLYPEDSNRVYEDKTSRIFRLRAGHHLQLVNLFSTCLCTACRLPLWGHHHQAYRCRDCSQLMHLDCAGVVEKCGESSTGKLSPGESASSDATVTSRISLMDLRKSFVEHYWHLYSTWESVKPMSSPGGLSVSSPASVNSAQSKDRWSYEEASCNASILTLQLELLKAGISRDEIQVLEWTEDTSRPNSRQNRPPQEAMLSSEFELVALQKHFTELTQKLQPLDLISAAAGSSSAVQSHFLLDFMGDSKPDLFLLFTEHYWHHLAAVTKTLICEASLGNATSEFLEDEMFSAKEEDGKLAASALRSVPHLSLASLLRFCIRRLGFQNAWTMQQILQEWVKLGLLERLDGELCLFEPIPESDQDSTSSIHQTGDDNGNVSGVNIVGENGVSSSSNRTSNPEGKPGVPRIEVPVNVDSMPVPILTRSTEFLHDSNASLAAGSTLIKDIVEQKRGSPVIYRSAPCLFPLATAIDPTPEVESLIQAVWRCLASVDLSLNELGFMLLTRQCWPDGFMSDYTVERLLGGVFYWLLMEDEQLFVIHGRYTSRGKRIPGIRHGLEDQITRKRILLNMSINGGAHENEGSNSSGATATNTNASSWGQYPVPLASAASGTGGSHSSLFGEVGAYVKTRKLMVKRFALPWLKRVLELDEDRYLEAAYRQIRILEREMAPQDDLENDLVEDHQRFQYAQAERYLDSITKLRHAGFLFTLFPKILSFWLKYVEGLSEGMDRGSNKGFKSLNRLFLKANQAVNSSRSGSGVGSNSTINTGGAVDSGSGSPTPTSSAWSENEWRQRLKSKLYGNKAHETQHCQSPLATVTTTSDPGLGESGQSSLVGVGSGSSSTAGSGSNVGTGVSAIATDSASLGDFGESPLSSLRTILDLSADVSVYASTVGKGHLAGGPQAPSKEEGLQTAIYWLGLMVQSNVPVPIQAFKDCCERMIDLSQLPLPEQQTINAHGSGHIAGLEATQEGALASKPDTRFLSQANRLLRACWECIVLASASTNQISQSGASHVVDAVLSTNQVAITTTLDHPLGYDVDQELLKSIQSLLKYSLVILMYSFGCPVQVILSHEIVPAPPLSKSSISHQGKTGPRPGVFGATSQLPPLSQQRPGSHLTIIDRDSVPINLLLACLKSPWASLQGEIMKGFSVILDCAESVSNMDDFIESIHKEVIACLWDLLSPEYDNMASTTLPLLMRFASRHPCALHKRAERLFSNPEWQVRFSALDAVFGLFSKLDDAMALKLFFQAQVQIPARTTTFGKRKASEKSHPLQHPPGVSESEFIMFNETLPGGSKNMGGATPGPWSNGGEGTSPFHAQQPQQPTSVVYTQFLSDRLEMLGPIFSHFVSSVWDKEDAIRTKATTLLRALQPVHLIHTLKAWELHFIASQPDDQQKLLKIMTRLNNQFPSWKIMDYDLVFQLLIKDEFGQTISTVARPRSGSMASLFGQTAASQIHAPNEAAEDDVSEKKPLASDTETQPRDDRDPYAKRASFHSGAMLESPYDKSANGSFGQSKESVTGLGAGGDESTRLRRRSLASSVLLDAPPMMAFMPAEDPSWSRRRVSMISATKSQATVSTAPAPPSVTAKELADALALEDDVRCSLLSLALQMVANGNEPRLDELIQLKYLVVFYLDFEGCDLWSLGQGKFQVRYGEYIPRQRVSPLFATEEEREEACGYPGGPLNDPGHENFVQAICLNLQLILDRHVEIKPDYEEDPPTLYEQFQMRGVIYGPSKVDTEYVVRDDHAAHGYGKDGSGRTFSTSGSSTNLSKGSMRDSMHRDVDNADYVDDFDEGDQLSQGRQDPFSFASRVHQHRRPVPSSLPVHDSGIGTKNSAINGHGHREQGQGSSRAERYQQRYHHHYRTNQHRRHHGDDVPVVGTYFVDVILRFFGSETELSALPAGRLRNWLELFLIVIYKYVREDDSLSDLVVVLMKRIVEMLMSKKGSGAILPPSTGHAGGVGGPGVGALPVPNPSTSTGEESLSEENILLAITICSTLLKRSSTMTTALLSREIMAMGKLMTKRRDDPDDPVMIRAKNFLHDAFVHFMGSGLFVLVFKNQPVRINFSLGWEEEQEVDQDLDLFYVLATVLGEDEWVPPEPLGSGTHEEGPSEDRDAYLRSVMDSRLVHIRDQPVRDILDRVMIFRDLEPKQVSTILTNLSLYVERVHSKPGDPNMMQDMGQFLMKVTKYTAEWDHHQRQKQKEMMQQLKQAQEHQQFLQSQQSQLHQQQILQQHGQPTTPPLHPALRSTMKGKAPQSGFAGNASTVISSGSTALSASNVNHPSQNPGVTSLSSVESSLGASAALESSNTAGTAVSSPGSQLDDIEFHEQGTEGVLAFQQQQQHPLQVGRQLSMPSSVATATAVSSLPSLLFSGSGSTTVIPPPPSMSDRLLASRKNTATSSDTEGNPYVQYRQQPPLNRTLSQPQHLPFRPPQYQPLLTQKRGHGYHWDYVNAVLGMCSTLMIQNPMEGRHLVSAVKHVLRQALYRDRISAPALIRLCAGYCYMSELDFSLPYVNAFGEFVVDILKVSIQYHGREQRYRDHEDGRESDVVAAQDEGGARASGTGVNLYGEAADEGNEDGEEGHVGESGDEEGQGSVDGGDNAKQPQRSHHRAEQYPLKSGKGRTGGRRRAKSDLVDPIQVGMHVRSGTGGGERVGGSGGGGGGLSGLGGGGHHSYANGRTKILASNLHLLHHLLMWDADPSYNMEWTRIKWDILGSMRFPPGLPLLFPAHEDLRQATAAIVEDWVDT